MGEVPPSPAETPSPDGREVVADLAASGARVRPGESADAVAGVVPRYVATPGDSDGAAALLAAAARHALTVVPRGNGSKIDWGAPPRGCDLLVDTSALTGVDHAAGDLVARVGAGVELAELRDTLSAANQHLSVDTAVERSTVGGVVATGLSGPRGLAHGAVRDLIIGMTVVRADGIVARSGGTVVKNVAGYDLAKLHTGALGTLGLITSVTFRLHPSPPARRIVHADAEDPATAAGWVRDVRNSQNVPTAIEIDAAGPGEPVGVDVLLEGAQAGVAARAESVATLLGGGGVARSLPGDWGRLPGGDTDTLLKIVTPIAETLDALARLWEHSASAGLAPRVRGSAGTGVVYAAIDAAADPEAVTATVSRLRHDLAAPGATVTILRPARPLRSAGVDLWGEIPGLELMRAVKHRFDPDHRLSPGRFAGGI